MPPPDRSFKSLKTATKASGTLAKALVRHLLSWKHSSQPPRLELGPDRKGIDLFLYDFAKEHSGTINRVLWPFNRAICHTTGHSMRPTCSGDNQIIWVERSYEGGHNIRTGDTVVALTPEKKRHYVHKRVLGAPGDTFVKRLGRSRINELAKV